MEEKLHQRRVAHLNEDANARTDHFMEKFKETIGEMFPKPPQIPWMPTSVAMFSVVAEITSEMPGAECKAVPLRLDRVSSVIADKAGEFCRYLALNLEPGETLTVTVTRLEDVPFSQVSPVPMPR